MSNVPFYVESMRWGNKYGNSGIIDGLAKDGLTDCYSNTAMGNAADFCAVENKISREDQDRYALESHRRAVASQQRGTLAEEITPIGGLSEDVGPRN